MEKDYQSRILRKYFNDLPNTLETGKVDVTINNGALNNTPHILIEFKENLNSQADIDKALTQIVLTCKKHNAYGRYYGIFGKYNYKDTFIFFEHDDVIFNSMAFDVNKEKFDIRERPSNPKPESIVNIVASLKGRTKEVQDYEIYAIVKELMNNNCKITITTQNAISIFLKWLDNIQFIEEITGKDDDFLVNLFFTDILNETIYKQKIKNPQQDFFDEVKCNTQFEMFKKEDKVIFTETIEETERKYYTIKNIDIYNNFWSIYNRPPNEKIFLEMFEKRHQFFTDTYRSKVGAQYTPQILIDLQNNILKENNINPENYIIFDPCCGTANLQSDFENKDDCYLSTLDIGDILVAESKGFKNIVKFDFLKDNEMPKWKCGDIFLDINEIAKRTKKEILVLINPPYEREMFIEFVEKIVKNVKNCKFFLYSHFKLFNRQCFFDRLNKLKPIIISNNIVSAELFGLSTWGVSMTLFDFNEKNKKELDSKIELTRYEKNKRIMEKQKQKVFFSPNKDLYKNYFKNKIKSLNTDLSKKQIILGHYAIMANGIIFDNLSNRGDLITSQNLEEILVSAGIFYKDHPKYYEIETMKAPTQPLTDEFKSNCIMSSLLYKNNKTINVKDYQNYLVPFTEKELGIPNLQLNVIYDDKKDVIFDFREWLEPYKKAMSQEAKDLYNASLELYKFYFKYFEKNADYNVGFFQLKDSFLQNTTELVKYKMSEKNVITGFSARKGENSTFRPSILDKKYKTDIFSKYDDALINLFTKIQDQMIEHGILETRMATLR